MQWVFLIGDDSFSLNSFSNMKFHGSIQTFRNEKRMIIRYANDNYAILEEYDIQNIKCDFAPLEFEEYLQKLPFDVPKWIMLKYNNIIILKKIISEKYFPEDVIIDCDGLNLGLKEVFDENRII